MKKIPNKIKRAYIRVEIDEKEVDRLADLLSQGIEEMKNEPTKLVVEEKKHLVCPGVLLVEDEKDIGGKLVQEGKIIPENKRFKIVIN